MLRLRRRSHSLGPWKMSQTCTKTQRPKKHARAMAAGYGDGTNHELEGMERVCQLVVKYDNPKPSLLSGIWTEMVIMERAGDKTDKKGMSRATEVAPEKSQPWACNISRAIGFDSSLNEYKLPSGGRYALQVEQPTVGPAASDHGQNSPSSRISLWSIEDV